MTTHAPRSSACGCALLKPFCRFVGMEPTPLRKSAQAWKEEMLVPAGAPVAFQVDGSGSPLPSHFTTSSAWHAASSSEMSAWQAAGQTGGDEVAERQLGGVAKAPESVRVTSGLAAVCEYVTTCMRGRGIFRRCHSRRMSKR